MNETAIQKKVATHFRELEKALGTFTFTAIPGGSVRVPPHIGKKLKDMGCLAGVSDLMFIAKEKVIFIELKTMTGTLSTAQKLFFKILDRFNQPNYCIRVEDDVEAIKVITGILRGEGVAGV
jgi:hypothetical protein